MRTNAVFSGAAASGDVDCRGCKAKQVGGYEAGVRQRVPEAVKGFIHGGVNAANVQAVCP